MAYINIKYRHYSFEESPGLISWLQLFLIKLLREQKEIPAWTLILAEEWELNAKIDIYKYFFTEQLLDDSDKENWAVTFTRLAISKLNTLSLNEFGQYINENINPDVDYERIKKNLTSVLNNLEGKEPFATYNSI